MKKSAVAAFLLSLVFIIFFAACKKEEKPMIDMNAIRTDGSHDDRYIFREEIEKEKAREQRDEKYREPGFK